VTNGVALARHSLLQLWNTTDDPAEKNRFGSACTSEVQAFGRDGSTIFMRHFFIFGAGPLLILGTLPLLAGCSAPAPNGVPGKEPPAVTVSYPLQREVTDYQDYTGRTAAVDSVQVQARVTGYLDKIYFKEGAEVPEGTVLYEIDPRPYKAAYDAAKAQVGQNVAALELARQNNARAQVLASTKERAIAEAELQQYESQEKQAVANLDFARANLESAKLNLDWTKVTAPVTGVIGRLLVTQGNLITANQTTLTTIVS
jgi:multidrug efflux pump subunit AcrA (membrane-fusion protein)